MENAITDLRIDNFKSIKSVRIKPKRINLFIGKPNVGKSNVLEAISLLNAPGHAFGADFLKDIIRFNELRDLFYEKQTSDPILVSSDIGHANLSCPFGVENCLLSLLKDQPYVFEDGEYEFIQNKKAIETKIIESQQLFYGSEEDAEVGNNYIQYLKSLYWDIPLHNPPSVQTIKSFLPVHKYDFRTLQRHQESFNKYLLPPFGQNLYNLLLANRELHKSIGPYFTEYEQQLLIRTQDRTLEVQRLRDGISVSYAYSMIADTLQRIIFYLAAIETNKNAVLLFEEPEAHAFPPYTTDLAHRIVNSNENQFFITTHSPYLFDIIVERTPIEELGVFVCYFEDYQTKIRALSAEEIQEAISDSLDVFFNLDRFTSHARA